MRQQDPEQLLPPLSGIGGSIKTGVFGSVILIVTVGLMLMNGVEPNGKAGSGPYSIGLIIGGWLLFSPIRFLLFTSTRRINARGEARSRRQTDVVSADDRSDADVVNDERRHE